LWNEDIASRVHFFGKVSDEEKNDLFARSDVLVAPSLYESFGLIFLEAMRFGKPVIGTDVGGIPEVVEAGQTGLLVPTEAPERLAEAMLRLGSSPDLRREMGAKGLRRFESLFSLYPLGRLSENFYRQVLEDWHGRSYNAPRRPSLEAAIVLPRPDSGRDAA
jgi:glycogen(starch) synthase